MQPGSRGPTQAGTSDARRGAASTSGASGGPREEMPALPGQGTAGHLDLAALPAPTTPAIAVSHGRTSSVPLGSAPPAARTPTLTAQIRAMQPPDVARQAVSELGVLARELAVLPEELEVSGLAPTHQRSYFEAAQAYLGLARQAWEAVAEERLEQAGAEPEYRQRAITVARRVSQLQQECRTARGNTTFQLPRRTPLYWRRRTALVRAGLVAFQDRLAPTPDPLEMGRGLFRMRGYLGLAGAGSAELGLLGLLSGASIVLVALLGLGLLLQLVAALISGSLLIAVSLGSALLATALVGVLVALLVAKGPVPVELLLGAAVFSPVHTTRHGDSGTPALALFLRAWWLLVGGLATLALLLALAFGGSLAGGSMPAELPSNAMAWAQLIGTLLALVFSLPALVGLAALVLLSLPVLVLTFVRCAAEVAGSPSWVPAARRYALEPALAVLAALTSLLAVTVWIATTAAGWQTHVLVAVTRDPVPLAVSWRTLALFAALVMPGLALQGAYWLGMRRWRRTWLGDLAGRRADVESHVRRLSVTDPRSGAQDTSEDNLRAMQYDLVLLQFYRDKIAEVARTRAAPFRPAAYLATGIVVVATTLLLDSMSGLLSQVLQLPH
jgi:hypothetical protein